MWCVCDFFFKEKFEIFMLYNTQDLLQTMAELGVGRGLQLIPIGKLPHKFYRNVGFILPQSRPPKERKIKWADEDTQPSQRKYSGSTTAYKYELALIVNYSYIDFDLPGSMHVIIKFLSCCQSRLKYEVFWWVPKPYKSARFAALIWTAWSMLDSSWIIAFLFEIKIVDLYI